MSQLKSNEILEELFNLCKVLNAEKIVPPSSSSDDDADIPAGKRKRKKKKKKHKKEKKRHRSSSASDPEQSSEPPKSSHKRKKKRHRRKSSGEDRKFKKLAIKTENASSDSELSADKTLMDTATGRALSIDEVFNSLGIVTGSGGFNGVKQEKIDDVKSVKVKTEENCKPLANERESAVSEEKNANNTEAASKCAAKTTRINDVFETVDETNLDEPYSKKRQKKISIKNLKSIYEATVKEVEEQERLKAEKYEEGELTTSSSSTDYDSSNESLTNKEDQKKPAVVEAEPANEKSKDHEQKHRSKSRENSKSKHHSRSRRTKHHSSQKRSRHKERKSRKDYKSPHDSDRVNRSHHRDYYEQSYYFRSSHRYSGYYARERDSSRDKSKSPKYHRSRTTFRDRSHSRTRSRVRSRSRSPAAEKIDKQKLLEIARKNAINLIKQGALPASVVANKDKIASIKAGGKTVDELTDFCKQLSKKDAEGQESISSGSDADSENDKSTAFHHPFQLKERPSNIVMNIRNAISLPTKTAQEKTLQLSKQLSLQYPVSSGQQHRTTESGWVPVEKAAAESAPTKAVVLAAASATSQKPSTQFLDPAAASIPFYMSNSGNSSLVAGYPSVDYNEVANSLLPATQNPNLDISSIVAQRLEAIRRLTENPQDSAANHIIQVADSKMRVWAESKVQPGLFTGSTGVKPLSAAELSSGCKAWAKKSQFTAAKPVYSDKGEALMKKMGWQPGEGLGKYKQGPSAPCEISMKTDRKGLAEQPPIKLFKQNNLTLQKEMQLLQTKHPVSLLNEYCSRKKIGVPQYDCEEKEAPGRRKLFAFSVTVQGCKYTPTTLCQNKKQSKVEAATMCLQNLGILPTVSANSV